MLKQTMIALTSAAAIGGVWSVSGLQAYAFTFDQKLTAPDGAAGNLFGNSVALSGNTALIGAFGDSSGSAYLFDVATGSLLQKLTPPDGAVGDGFGGSVALSGNIALIGALNDDDNGDASGSAYLFDVTTGSLLQKLTPPDGAVGDIFGEAVTLSGNTALIGAPFGDGNALSSGSAYLFDVTTGGLLQKLTAPDGAVGDFFGGSVALSGNTALIGAGGDDDDNVGSAYLFDVATGSLLQKLTAPDGAAGDIFGGSVALSGNTALIGAPTDFFANGNGAAYLFDVTTGSLLQKLTAPDGAAGDFFGQSVALSGNTALIGAIGDDVDASNSGSAYLFDITTGSLLQKLTAPDGADFDVFGESVALSGNTALIGAGGDDDNGNSSGSAYLFRQASVTDPESVPEPASLLGVAAIGAVAAGGALKKKAAA